MIAVRPFRGLRYSLDAVKSLGSTLAPPYDVIDDHDRRTLYGSGLRNVVRIDSGLDYPGDEPGHADRYRRAAAHLAAWRSLGVLIQERSDAYYVTAHAFTLATGEPATRIGILAAVRIDDDAPAPLVHERTAAQPVGDRLDLMRATSTATSPIFAVWDPELPALDLLLSSVMARPPLGSAPAPLHAGETVTLWVVDDPDECHAITSSLEQATLLIADGHHRLSAARSFARERRAASGSQPSDWTLMYLTSAHSPALNLQATHRVLTLPGRNALPDPLAASLGALGTLKTYTTRGRALAALTRHSRAAEQAVVLLDHGRYTLLELPPVPGDRRASLAVTAVTDRILPALASALGMTLDELSSCLSYTHDAGEVARLAERDPDRVAGILLPPCTIDDVVAVARDGHVLPRKSTYFSPKVPTGLVLLPLDA